jgi:hypothetical protein
VLCAHVCVCVIATNLIVRHVVIAQGIAHQTSKSHLMHVVFVEEITPVVLKMVLFYFIFKLKHNLL